AHRRTQTGPVDRYHFTRRHAASQAAEGIDHSKGTGSESPELVAQARSGRATEHQRPDAVRPSRFLPLSAFRPGPGNRAPRPRGNVVTPGVIQQTAPEATEDQQPRSSRIKSQAIVLPGRRRAK